jgi:hypothetical protein
MAATFARIFSGHNPMPGLPRLNWPNQGNPPTADWKLWQQALRKCFLLSRTDMQLRGPLGRWLLDAPPHWPCWYDVIGHCVYLMENGKWRKYRPKYQGLQLQSNYTKYTLHDELPPHTLQAIGWSKDDILTFTGRARGLKPPLATPTSINDAIASYKPSLQWALAYIKQPDDLTSPLQVHSTVLQLQSQTAPSNFKKRHGGIHARQPRLRSPTDGSSPCPRSTN